MRNRISINETDVISNQSINAFTKQGPVSDDIINNKNNIQILISEGFKNFATYINWLGLAKDPDLVILSSKHHYYYDAEDLQNVRTVVNLKELNRIKEIKSFIHSIFRILPDKSYFIGYFIDNKRMNGYAFRNKKNQDQSEIISEAVENGIVSRNPFLNMIYNILDYRIDRYLSRNDVILLLEERGFRILDLTEFLGITYFCAQRLGHAR